MITVDHTRIYYAPFRKNFYVEVPEIAKMTAEGKSSTFYTLPRGLVRYYVILSEM